MLFDRPATTTRPRVGVVITTYNHARYLAAAIESVLGQSLPAEEIIVVDDGSGDHPEVVASAFPAVRLIRQANQGLSAARNTGLRHITAELVTFLDADDLLTSRALELGARALQSVPGAAFAHGAYRIIDEAGRPTSPDYFTSLASGAFEVLLGRNAVGMHGAVLFERTILLESGGYDIGLRRCEDYDVYLRLVRKYPVASYPEVAAEYRLHGENMSRDRAAMLAGALEVLDRHATNLSAREARAARKGRALWRGHYARGAFGDAALAVQRKDFGAAAQALLISVRASPRGAASSLVRGVGKRIQPHLPSAIASSINRLRGRGLIGKGHWRMGDFNRTAPASADFGFDRGQPIDRFYVADFLDRHRADIAGRTLEIGDDAYLRRYGGTQLTQVNILDVDASNGKATIVGDLSQPGILPEAAFDCIVLTQTLHFIFDMPAAVRELHRSLKPGGILLVTSPGISPVDRGEWGKSWYWSLTPAAALRLFCGIFQPAGVEITPYGNFYAASAFLAGLAVEEVEPSKLEEYDEGFPVIVGIRARKIA